MGWTGQNLSPIYARLDWIGSEEISDGQNISWKNIYRLEQRISTGKAKVIEMDERWSNRAFETKEAKLFFSSRILIEATIRFCRNQNLHFYLLFSLRLHMPETSAGGFGRLARLSSPSYVELQGSSEAGRWPHHWHISTWPAGSLMRMASRPVADTEDRRHLVSMRKYKHQMYVSTTFLIFKHI